METLSRPLRLLDTYNVRLDSWTLQAACQRQCESRSQSCACDRTYVHVPKFEEWLQRKETDDTRNIDRLLAELHPEMRGHRTIPFRADHILGGESKCVRVFGTLLKIGYGHLIDLFHKARIYDRFLQEPSLHYLDNLEKVLKANNVFQTTDRMAEVLTKFEEYKWAFCHPILTLHVDEDYDGARFILPFCRYDPVNGKGGTATVFQALVQKHLVTDTKLAHALHESLHKDSEHGECYKLAVKTFSYDATDIYEWEKEAFSAFRDNQDSPIVKYLGSFSHGEGDHKAHKLLLEYGDMDLDEYCADLENVAPVQSGEIIRFWKSLFEVARAIKDVHYAPIKHGKTTEIYNGWHADVKPDNILLVHGKFKLADFGFARFSMTAKDGKPPEQFIMGGTDTYGAPELARSQRAQTLTPVKQTIDTWSFGCVLSIAATWIVLGFQGIEQFRKLRIIANSDRPANRKQGSDRFHDGSQVLPEIISWHDYIRNHVRKADTITARVLSLIDDHMLRDQPDARYTSAKLCNELTYISKVAEHNVVELLEAGELAGTDVLVQRALLAVEKEARQDLRLSTDPTSEFFQFDISQPGNSETRRITFNAPGSKSKRFGKEEKLQRLPPAKTLHREQMLEQELEKKQYHLSLPSGPADPIDSSGRHGGAFTSSPNEMNDEQIMPRSLSIVNDLFIPNIFVDSPDHTNNGYNRRPSLDMVWSQIAEPTANCYAPETPYRGYIGPQHWQPSLDLTQSNLAKSTPFSSDPLGISPALPSAIAELPFDICRTRMELDSERKSRSSFQKLKAKLKGEDQAKDEHLAKFINGRDLVFVIDNGTSMFDYWPIVTYVAETLANKVAGLDKDGFDIAFTVNGETYDKRNLCGKRGRADFAKALHDGKPSIPQEEEYHVPTDIYHTFHRLFRSWEDSEKAPITWIVLTDGRWEGTHPPDLLEKRIIELGKTVQSIFKFEARHCSIGFVHFGNQSTPRLVYLDDKLCKDNALNDFIDQCSWRESVHKMLLGSLSSHLDQRGAAHAESTDELRLVDDKSLAKLFDDHLSGTLSTSLASPSFGFPRPLSRTSSSEVARRQSNHDYDIRTHQYEASLKGNSPESSSKFKPKLRISSLLNSK